MSNFQRIGSISNAHAGRDFEDIAKAVLEQKGIRTRYDYEALVGVGNRKKHHKFDLGSDEPRVLVECKSHTWTSGDNMPSAKIQNWSEAMYYFHIAPSTFRKIFFIQKSKKKSSGESLGAYYLRTRFHLVPPDVEFWEFDVELKTLEILDH
ncbi:hypothetical protein [Ponticaulis profundi]|uniref:Restriction endonuclease n=1 Tax=Ponticaulis profundi TaxID=2665222 RepID=A0ABW1SDK3_9PROT